MTAPAASAADEIRVRMYRIGFGDCFLVTFPGPRHVLVDCGVHGRGDIGTLERVVADIEAETGGRIALVIASHAHEDHVAGFRRFADTFRRFTIGEIWLPWSEDRSDAVATGFAHRQAALRQALDRQFAARPPRQEVLDILDNAAAARTEPALANLRAGLGTGAKVSYLRGGTVFESPGGITGLTADILGPPHGDEFLRQMDPPKAERYLRATGAVMTVEGALRPFGDVQAPDDDGPRLTAAQREDLQAAVDQPPEALAMALDRVINNTSVVALFTYRGRRLLFAGDSQYGGWRSWLERPETGDALAGLTFYKVAHHGSENATPRSALEAMGDGVLAMLSTQSVPWPSIPYSRLMDALVRKTGGSVVRSDSLPVDGAPVGPVAAPLPAGFTAGALWIDCHIVL